MPPILMIGFAAKHQESGNMYRIPRATAPAMFSFAMMLAQGCSPDFPSPGASDERVGPAQQALSNTTDIYTMELPGSPIVDVTSAWIRSTEFSQGTIANTFTTDSGESAEAHAGYSFVAGNWN